MAGDGLPRMTLPEHLDELRRRVFRSLLALAATSLVAFFFYGPLWDLASAPYQDMAAQLHLDDQRLSALDPGEGFLQVLKFCFLVGVVLASPVILWQLWGFVAAGLYHHERRVVRIFFPISMALFALGVLAAYLLLIPFGLRFLMAWNQELGFRTSFRVSTYLDMCLMSVFGMGLCFETPLVMLFVQATGLVSRKTLLKGWRWAVLGAFVLGMVLTDPSPVTQTMMAVPLIGLYFLGIWGGRFVGENAETFRLWKAWPLLLAAAIFVAMLLFADEINAWSTRVLGLESAPPSSSR